MKRTLRLTLFTPILSIFAMLFFMSGLNAQTTCDDPELTQKVWSWKESMIKKTMDYSGDEVILATFGFNGGFDCNNAINPATNIDSQIKADITATGFSATNFLASWDGSMSSCVKQLACEGPTVKIGMCNGPWMSETAKGSIEDGNYMGFKLSANTSFAVTRVEISQRSTEFSQFFPTYEQSRATTYSIGLSGAMNDPLIMQDANLFVLDNFECNGSQWGEDEIEFAMPYQACGELDFRLAYGNPVYVQNSKPRTDKPLAEINNLTLYGKIGDLQVVFDTIDITDCGGLTLRAQFYKGLCAQEELISDWTEYFEISEGVYCPGADCGNSICDEIPEVFTVTLENGSSYLNLNELYGRDNVEFKIVQGGDLLSSHTFTCENLDYFSTQRTIWIYEDGENTCETKLVVEDPTGSCNECKIDPYVVAGESLLLDCSRYAETKVEGEDMDAFLARMAVGYEEIRASVYGELCGESVTHLLPLIKDNSLSECGGKVVFQSRVLVGDKIYVAEDEQSFELVDDSEVKILEYSGKAPNADCTQDIEVSFNFWLCGYGKSYSIYDRSSALVLASGTLPESHDGSVEVGFRLPANTQYELVVQVEDNCGRNYESSEVIEITTPECISVCDEIPEVLLLNLSEGEAKLNLNEMFGRSNIQFKLEPNGQLYSEYPLTCDYEYIDQEKFFWIFEDGKNTCERKLKVTGDCNNCFESPVVECAGEVITDCVSFNLLSGDLEDKVQHHLDLKIDGCEDAYTVTTSIETSEEFEKCGYGELWVETIVTGKFGSTLCRTQITVLPILEIAYLKVEATEKDCVYKPKLFFDIKGCSTLEWLMVLQNGRQVGKIENVEPGEVTVPLYKEFAPGKYTFSVWISDGCGESKQINVKVSIGDEACNVCEPDISWDYNLYNANDQCIQRIDFSIKAPGLCGKIGGFKIVDIYTSEIILEVLPGYKPSGEEGIRWSKKIEADGRSYELQLIINDVYGNKFESKDLKWIEADECQVNFCDKLPDLIQVKLNSDGELKLNLNEMFDGQEIKFKKEMSGSLSYEQVYTCEDIGKKQIWVYLPDGRTCEPFVQINDPHDYCNISQGTPKIRVSFDNCLSLERVPNITLWVYENGQFDQEILDAGEGVVLHYPLEANLELFAFSEDSLLNPITSGDVIAGMMHILDWEELEGCAREGIFVSDDPVADYTDIELMISAYRGKIVTFPGYNYFFLDGRVIPDPSDEGPAGIGSIALTVRGNESINFVFGQKGKLVSGEDSSNSLVSASSGTSELKDIVFSRISVDEGVLKQNIAEIEFSGTEDTLLDAYPNPASESIWIKTTTATDYLIQSVNGVNVLSGKIDPGNNQIDISELPSGVLILSIGTEKRLIIKK